MAFCRSNMGQNHFVSLNIGLKSVFHTEHIIGAHPSWIHYIVYHPQSYRWLSRAEQWPAVRTFAARVRLVVWWRGQGRDQAASVLASAPEPVASLPPTHPPASSLSPLSCSPQVTTLPPLLPLLSLTQVLVQSTLIHSFVNIWFSFLLENTQKVKINFSLKQLQCSWGRVASDHFEYWHTYKVEFDHFDQSCSKC